MKKLITEAEFETEKASQENREYAIKIIDRIELFNERWQDNYYKIKDEKEPYGALYEAFQKVKFLLPAIGGKVNHIQGVSSGTRIDHYSITLKNGLNRRNFSKVISQESVFATLYKKMELLKRLIHTWPECDKDIETEGLIYHNEDNLKDQAEQILIHALHHRSVIQNVSGNHEFPMVISPLAERILKILYTNNRNAIKRHIKSGLGEYYFIEDNIEGILKRSQKISLDKIKPKKILDIIYYSTGKNIQIGSTKSILTECSGKLDAQIVEWFISEGSQVSYSSEGIEGKFQLPTSVLASMNGDLEEYIDHWLTNDLGIRVNGLKNIKKTSFNQDKHSIAVTERQGSVVYLPYSKASLMLENNPANFIDLRKIRDIPS